MKRNQGPLDSEIKTSLNSDATTVDPWLTGEDPITVKGLSPNEHVALRRLEIARTVLSDEVALPPPTIEVSLSNQ